ncbi:MAG: ankyrin repeat domain-containing protein [Legionella sp.]|jgi:ankyrin repeat protein
MHLMAIHGYDDLLKDVLATCEHLAFQATNFQVYPIHTAILNRQLNAVQQLLQIKGMDAVGDENKRNALHYAVIYGNPEIVSVCCQHSTDLDAKDNDGMTALMMAAKDGNLAAVEELIKKGATPLLIDSFGKNILHYAVESEHADLVAWILKNIKIDVNSKDEEGKTALYYAQNPESFNVNSQIEELLVAKGATNPDSKLLTN